MWTAASGVGFAALLKGKPVSYFMRDYDYNYGPIARFTESADEAFADDYVLDYDIVRRYFTWYYKAICVDLKDPNVYNVIDEKLHNYFRLEYSLDEMLTV
jgi:ABC-type dipeptide/oligopeptide/nickel transport system permease component